MKLNLMSEEDAYNLNVGDTIYDSNNRKVEVINKTLNTLLIEKYMTKGQKIVLHTYMTYIEIAQNYTTHIKEDNHGTNRDDNDQSSKS